LVTRGEGIVFNELKRLCALTDGNLSRHLDVLQEPALIEAGRGSDGGRPQTLYRLTQEGRARFVSYLEELEQVVRDALPKAAKRPERAPDLPPRSHPGCAADA